MASSIIYKAPSNHINSYSNYGDRNRDKAISRSLKREAFLDRRVTIFYHVFMLDVRWVYFPQHAHFQFCLSSDSLLSSWWLTIYSTLHFYFFHSLSVHMWSALWGSWVMIFHVFITPRYAARFTLQLGHYVRSSFGCWMEKIWNNSIYALTHLWIAFHQMFLSFIHVHDGWVTTKHIWISFEFNSDF